MMFAKMLNKFTTPLGAAIICGLLVGALVLPLRGRWLAFPVVFSIVFVATLSCAGAKLANKERPEGGSDGK